MPEANIGLGHGAIDAGGGYTYFNQQNGREFSAVTGFTYNFDAEPRQQGPFESSAVVEPTKTVVLRIVDAERHLLTELRSFELASRPPLPV
jgi:hypothetical protein